MATIHSLPTELIQHTLKLAYPPEEYGSQRGLAQASLVHSSWTKPSQSLLTAQLLFTGFTSDPVRSFVGRGPDRFASQLIYFGGTPADSVCAVLGKARASGVRHLALWACRMSGFENLFGLASLQGLDSVELVDLFAKSELEGQVKLELNPWPENLKKMTISLASLPPALFSGSADTLTSLALDWYWAVPEDQLVHLKHSFPNVAALALKRPGSLESFGWTDAVLAFVVHFPRLSSLTLTELWPTQLEQLLTGLQPHQILSHLAVSLWEPRQALARRDPAHMTQIWAGWAPALQRCLGLPTLRELKCWRMTLQPDRHYIQYSADFFARWQGQPPAWTNFQAALAAAGIELVLGPLDD